MQTIALKSLVYLRRYTRRLPGVTGYYECEEILLSIVILVYTPYTVYGPVYMRHCAAIDCRSAMAKRNSSRFGPPGRG